MGDFYESFDDDAQILADVLGIALTSRPMGREGRIPLAGVPHHQLERHLTRLIAAGYRVAIAEQLSPPGRGLVERAVVRVVSPGTIDAGEAVEGGAHNWLVAAVPGTAARSTGPGKLPLWGVARCDVTTGELELELVPEEELAGEWARLGPAELLLPDEPSVDDGVFAAAVPPSGCALTLRPVRDFTTRRAAERLTERFGIAELESYGLEGLDAAVAAAGALLYTVAPPPGAFALL